MDVDKVAAGDRGSALFFGYVVISDADCKSVGAQCFISGDVGPEVVEHEGCVGILDMIGNVGLQRCESLVEKSLRDGKVEGRGDFRLVNCGYDETLMGDGERI